MDKVITVLIGVIMIYIIFITLSLGVSYLLPSVNTVYASNFDEKQFMKIEKEQTIHFVESSLGKPLHCNIDNSKPDSIETLYWYTRSKHILFLGYEQIRVDFYKGKVIRKAKFISD